MYLNENSIYPESYCWNREVFRSMQVSDEDSTEISDEDSTEMVLASKNGHWDTVWTILDKKPYLVNSIPKERAWAVLHQAVWCRTPTCGIERRRYVHESHA